MDGKKRRNRFNGLVGDGKEETVETVQASFSTTLRHRAKATVLMRSLRRDDVVVRPEFA
jgi:hypothetical protein